MAAPRKQERDFTTEVEALQPQVEDLAKVSSEFVQLDWDQS